MYQTDKSDVSITDYSIFVKNIPKNTKVKEIKQYFLDIAAKLKISLEIEKINMCYDIKDYKRLKSEFYNLAIKDYSKFISKEEKDTIQKQINALKEKIGNMENSCTKEETKHCGCCFISFKNEQMVVDILKFF